LTFADVKTARSRRDQPLPDELVDALRRHRARQSEERLAAGTHGAGSACVFTTPIGTPVDPRNDFRCFKQLLAAAGVRDVRLHDLRHTAATLLLAQGVPARVVMKILGHRQIGLTMNTYTHVASEVLREATSRMTQTLWSQAQ